MYKGNQITLEFIIGLNNKTIKSNIIKKRTNLKYLFFKFIKIEANKKNIRSIKLKNPKLINHERKVL